MRSLIDPPGFRCSHFTSTGTGKPARDALERHQRRAPDVLQDALTIALHAHPYSLVYSHDFSKSTLPRCQRQLGARTVTSGLRLGVEVAAAEAGLAAADLDEALAVAVEALAAGRARRSTERDVLGDDLGLAVREHAGLRQRLAELRAGSRRRRRSRRRPGSASRACGGRRRSSRSRPRARSRAPRAARGGAGRTRAGRSPRCAPFANSSRRAVASTDVTWCSG